MNKEIMDINEAVEQLGDKEFYFELVDDFIASFDQKIKYIKNCIDKIDYEALRIEVHTIKGVSANLCLGSIKNSAYDFENDIRIKKYDDLNKHLRVLETKFNELIEYKKSI